VKKSKKLTPSVFRLFYSVRIYKIWRWATKPVASICSVAFETIGVSIEETSGMMVCKRKRTLLSTCNHLSKTPIFVNSFKTTYETALLNFRKFKAKMRMLHHVIYYRSLATIPTYPATLNRCVNKLQKFLRFHWMRVLFSFQEKFCDLTQVWHGRPLTKYSWRIFASRQAVACVEEKAVFHSRSYKGLSAAKSDAIMAKRRRTEGRGDSDSHFILFICRSSIPINSS